MDPPEVKGSHSIMLLSKFSFPKTANLALSIWCSDPDPNTFENGEILLTKHLTGIDKTKLIPWGFTS